MDSVLASAGGAILCGHYRHYRQKMSAEKQKIQILGFPSWKMPKTSILTLECNINRKKMCHIIIKVAVYCGYFPKKHFFFNMWRFCHAILCGHYRHGRQKMSAEKWGVGWDFGNAEDCGRCRKQANFHIKMLQTCYMHWTFCHFVRTLPAWPTTQKWGDGGDFGTSEG